MEVYFALNTINGKAYVGWTKDTAPVRFKRHCSNAAAGSPYAFHRAIRKYGADAFHVLSVWKGDDAEEMKQVERNYIAGMRTNDSQRGYNMTAGGDGIYGHRHSEETRRKMVKNRLPMTEECRAVRSTTMKGLWSTQGFADKRRQGMVGHAVSDECRKNISKAQKGHEVSGEQRAKLSAANLGKEHSTDTKTKIGAAVSSYRKQHPESYTMLNPTKGGRFGGHSRWHVKRGITKPGCVLCEKGGY
jgi:group I intron endonuclease